MTLSLSLETLKLLAATTIILPGLSALGLLIVSFFSLPWKEEWIERLIRSVMVVIGLCAVALAWQSVHAGPLWLSFGDWLTLSSMHFGLSLILDSLSIPYLITSGFIAAIVGYFSARYLHRDPGFLRFFTLYLVFVTGLNITILASSLLVLVVGWELIGLSSVLLVGFYRERRGPVAGALVVFTAYRVGDLGMHGLTISLPLLLGHDTFPGAMGLPVQSSGSLALVCSLLIILAAACKSAQGPFSLWLPRAMEGPTPSSAIFYGALSVHMGAYFLLRTSPIWRAVDGMPWLIAAIGLSTTLFASGVGRTRADIKSMLAFASMAQLGLIFVEISLGWDQLALWHMVGHTMLRTLQFLRSPSAISDWMRFGRLQGWRAPNEAPIESHLGLTFERKLYSLVFSGWGLDKAMRSVLVKPLLHVSDTLNRAGFQLSLILDGSMTAEQKRLLAKSASTHAASAVVTTSHVSGKALES